MVKTLIMITDSRGETPRLMYVEVSTEDITNPFTINENDVFWVEQMVNEHGAVCGELECIVEHGPINVEWKISLDNPK